MNSNSYIIQKLNNTFKHKCINPTTLNQKKLNNIFEELGWDKINNIIPDVLIYYSNFKENQMPNIINNRKLHFINFLDDKMNDIKIYVTILEKNHSNSPVYYKYKSYYEYYIINKERILHHFNEIISAFEIVNIKYDRVNFLPYNFIVNKILSYMGNIELANYVSDIKTIEIFHKLDKIWEEMENHMKWNV
jgi:hypothetical protein